MKTPSEVIPKFIISLEKNTDRNEYINKEIIPKISNHIKCKAFDGENDDPNPILEENNLIIAEHFIEKCNSGQLGCFLSHFHIWKYVLDNKLDYAIILEDDVKIYKNFNRIINTIFDNLPKKFDYVHLFTHPDKQKEEYLLSPEGDITNAQDNFGTVAYLLSIRGAKKLIKLTQLLKIQAPLDRQINYYIEHNFLNAYQVKRPFITTQGEIMPNRAMFDNAFKSNIWYSKKLKEINKIQEKFIKPAGFNDDEINNLDKQIENHQNKRKTITQSDSEEDLLPNQEMTPKNELETQTEITPKNELEVQTEITPKNELEVQSEITPKNELEVQSEIIHEINPEKELEVQSEITPENKLEVQSEITPEKELEVQSEITPEITPEKELEVQSEITPEKELEVQSEITPEITPEKELEVQSEITPEKEFEVQSEIIPEKEFEVQSEITPEKELEVQSEENEEMNFILQLKEVIISQCESNDDEEEYIIPNEQIKFFIEGNINEEIKNLQNEIVNDEEEKSEEEQIVSSIIDKLKMDELYAD